MKRAFFVLVLAATFGLGIVAAVAAQPSADNPGSPGDNCSHGSSNTPCKPDPQPDRGKDCEDHGRARGNEDHCLDETTTHTTTDTHTDTTDTHTDTTDTHTDTTHTDTTDTHTDTGHTTTDTHHGG